MKKYIINFCLAIMLIHISTSCSDWLDVEQKDRYLEEKQFSTELGINKVLNGIYIELKSNSLYGASLSKTTVEQLAHYYYVPISVENNSPYMRFHELQHYNYTTTEVKNAFSTIWSGAYKLIFRINIFISNVEKSTVITPEKRNVLLGEAYALRAFIHLDLFRLFGPIYNSESESKLSIPYNDVDNATTLEPKSAKEFMDKLFADLEVAEGFLENDPILEVGILNPNEEVGLSSVEIFEKYARNKRLNIIAVKALHARALAVAGRVGDAAIMAKEIINAPGIIENIDGANADALFKWIIPSNISNNEERDYIFKSEVLFSFHNADLYTNWKTLTKNTAQGSVYTVHRQNLLSNIFNRPDAGSLEELSDIRARQWSVAAEMGANEFISIRYSEYSDVAKENSIKYMQPLIRMTELFYLILEDEINNGRLDAAGKLANSLMIRRGYKENELFETTPTETALKDFLFREYYREFYAEGQTFFFLKRNSYEKIFKSTGTGSFDDMNLFDYVVPLPDNEILN